MTKVSLRKLSMLGLVLMAASAVTAAIVPSKSKAAKLENSEDNGRLLNASGLGTGGGVDSCVFASGAPTCHVTADTTTGDNSSLVGTRTDGNTSHSNSQDSVDTTSVVS